MTSTPTRPAADVPGAGDLYRVAVEEYRFQAQFNWSRTQYLLAFNAAILAAAVAVSGGRPAALVFGLGAVAAVLSASAVHTQHGYYRAARDRMRQVEERMEVPVEQRVTTTAVLGGRRRPRPNVTQVTYLLFAALFLAHVVGAVVVLQG
ncbi:hypothetical protein WDZ17_09225 [Pseudokineococcus basanitobsidens]|uniref:DUF202 domain-containing protein n=1 Tax=Pseudokineococcus basanitobsidens TaxID=1926649 RepID=A0ABU8RK93_9ACTN